MTMILTCIFMYLGIDNSDFDKIILYFSNGDVWKSFDFSKKKYLNLISAVNAMLKKKKVKLSELKGIAVRVGEGSFTAARVAVVMANTLAFALQVPVVEVIDFNKTEPAKLFKNKKAGSYILPTYYAEPRIGGK